MAAPEKHGLAKQFTRLIVLSGLASFLLLGFLQVVLNKGLRLYFDQPEVQQQASQRQVDELQTYIDENELSSTDIKKLTDWTRSHRYNLLELYRDQKLIYSSYAPRHYYKNDDPEAPELTDSHQHGPFYDWSPVYTLNFSDGEITALLYYNGFDACYSTGCDFLLIICLASFPLFFLWGSRGIVKYIVQLSEEIQAMEGGDLDHPITVQGSDELTTLASSLDSMRLTLRQQHEDEAAAAAKVKNLITEMSHDLRTPLTTLLLYTEILRHRKYETTAQAEDYLAKIDTKARQLKQLSDNLFEYALVTRDTVAVLDPPARFSQIFEEPLTEMVGELQERGFACALELGEEDDTLTVKEQYVRRILDNITSNLLKYADPAQDISVRFVKEKGKAGLAFENAVLPGQHRTDSTKVGLTSNNRGNDRRNETTPILGRQTKHDLQQAAKHHGAGDCAITLMLRDRHGGRDVGEGNAGDHRQTGTNQPHTVQLQAGAETCDQQAGLNDGGGLRGIHLGGRGHQEDRREIRHEHGHDVLQAERNALPERHRCVKTAQRLKRHAFFHVFCLRLFFGFLCVLLFAQLLHPLL